MDIKIGDKVKSYDNEYHDSWVEGVVVAVDVKSVPMEGGKNYEFDCPRYAIQVTGKVRRDGKQVHEFPPIVYPPMNGTHTWFGRVTNEVERVEG